MPKTQDLRLQELMQKHHSDLFYTLSLPPVEVKKSKITKLKEGDLFLLNLDYLELVLCREEKVYATLDLSVDDKYAKIKKVYKNPIKYTDTKKYQTIFFNLSMVKVPSLEHGSMVEMPHVERAKIEIMTDEKQIAQGALATVDGKIAVNTTKVFE